MLTDLIARALDVVAEGLGRGLDAFADGAGWLSDVSGEASETARWWAKASRLVP